MKMPMLIPSVVIAILFVAAVRAQDKSQRPDKEAVPAAKVGELRKARIAILKETAEMSLKLAQGSRLGVEVALEDRMALLKAESEVMESEAERVALFKRTLETLATYEKLARAQKEAALGTELAVLRVKARRQEVEILLEQAKAKETQKGK